MADRRRSSSSGSKPLREKLRQVAQTELVEELCTVYKRLIDREHQLIEALQRIRDLEALLEIQQQEQKQQPSRHHKPVSERASLVAPSEPRITVITQPAPQNDENYNDPQQQQELLFHVTVRPAKQKRELKFVDMNRMEVTEGGLKQNRSSPKSANSRKSEMPSAIKRPDPETPPLNRTSPRASIGKKIDWSSEAERHNLETPPTRAVDSRRATAMSILSVPPPPPPSTILRETRPPFIPASREGNINFNIHSLRQKREREKIIEEPARIRHRPVIQQPPRDTR